MTTNFNFFWPFCQYFDKMANMERNQKSLAVVILMLIFTVWFLHNTKLDFHLIFQKDLLAQDESSNSVVEANITRKFFPPMVRVNPLNEQQGNWMEGPYWQHIPPLFAYVPYLFFKLDGQVTIEVKRLSYAFVVLLTGFLFIWSIYRFKKSLLAAGAAALAAFFWISTPFTQELITGYAFGVSDIVLAFTAVCGFSAVLWYLEREREERINYPFWKLAAIGLIVALPIMAKNILGAIPGAAFFGLLLWDRKMIDKKVLAAAGSFLVFLALYFLPLYFASPQTFKIEFLVSFLHFKQLEGWGRPWHWYVTNYLTQRYLGRWTWVYYLGLMLGVILNYKFEIIDRKDRILLWLSGGWFIWNLVAISLVTSKVPNFIYQSYLFSLFFVIYAILAFARRAATRQSALGRIEGAPQFRLPRLASEARRFVNKAIVAGLILSMLATAYESVRFIQQFKVQRAQAYDYQTEHEKFYQTAEELRTMGLNTKDLMIVRVSDNDCWFRYYPLFLTGTESKTLLEINFGYDPDAIKQQYSRMFFVENKSEPDFNENRRIELADYSLLEFDLGQLNPGQIKALVDSFVSFHAQDIQQDILRIKKDKTSCQWLVPDPILNAP